MSSRTLIGLDVGEKRIGVSVADLGVKIAVPLETIEVDGSEIQKITEIVLKQSAGKIVIGYPRNQSGEPTTQTTYVENFAKLLRDIDVDVIFQDESLTSVIAEQQLVAHNRPYSKGDIDARAATIILQDYLEAYHG